ncbi:hypothetical protein N781_18370 [Pontibacillus halophilus JSM 076056 = DSM 19796]|uniref:Uncharacterized protein n=1 Tax=Pontibacillus halophilus JSM 076056 = DSM 19796 TaxID=1385510 RepID=A0A0A5I8X9_9BACI|nr:hypothetical protein [Pontibacillus halophilus]KGX92297.1 hypothetical protein N781_18370 [Pontibacillus halophilus JSM 076056 = DSM 19796]
MNEATHTAGIKAMNKKALGSILIGTLAIIGPLLAEKGSILNIAGFILALMAVREIKLRGESGLAIACTAVALNLFGVITLMM